MSKQISILLLIFVTSVCAFAQTEKYDAPVNWERYKVSEKEVSILLPKIPTLISGFDVCSQVESGRYTVYAENVVYGLNITAKLDGKPPSFCENIKRFDEKRFADQRLKELKSQLNTTKETKFNLNGLEVVKIANETFSYWLINDDDKGRWFELWAANADETNAVVKNFIESIKIEKNPSGIEIGKGSFRILGDETANNKDEPVDTKTAYSDKEIVKIKYIVKQIAHYTEEARQNRIQGSVQLRVTFLASGGIGEISPLATLPHGLTEQAIAAAAKIAFIPAKKNGVPISIVGIVEYHFNIY
ncbi:MAG: TonB family protein [Acidobacteriota bacterium]